MHKFVLLATAWLSSLAAVVVAVNISSGSSHREAPLTSADPLGDDTDVWAFTPKGLRIDPSSAAATTERGILRLGAPRLPRRSERRSGARRLAPQLVKPLRVIVDANVALGRYQDAERELSGWST